MKKEYTDSLYDSAIADLFKRFPSFQKQGAQAYKPGLDHSFEICRRMGNPQDCYPCIHVAGTNGKGSTCNMLAAQFASKGMKAGLYTSPHILDFRERMRIVTADGATLASRRCIWDMLQDYESDFQELDLSFFEITTAMAFRFFADQKVDIAIIETGLGGRLDATNVIKPELSVITNIGFDHMDLLGNTLPLIAAEKAGIIKAGVPVVIGESHPDTDPVFRSIAKGLNSPISFADSGISKEKEALMEQILPLMDLKGSYQRKNLCTVMAALEVLGEKACPQALGRAAEICDFHGRWEVIAQQPFTICDIGHNRHGLKYNFGQLDAMLDSGKYSDLVMVYGSVADKDIDAVLEILPQRAYIFFTAADNHRAMPADQLMARAGHSRGEVRRSVASAVKAAVEKCRGLEKPLLYIGGSTYVVSEAIPAIDEELKTFN